MTNEHEQTSNEHYPDRHTAIKIIGVGGAGSNAVDRLKMEGMDRLPLAVVNTDSQALASSPVEEKCMIGRSVTRGLGAGGDPEVGRAAAEADLDRIAPVVAGTDLVFLLAGMGGGTGSGSAPVVAKAASDAGALVIAFVTLPFDFEGSRRQKQADDGLASLRKTCDAVIPLPNDILLQQTEEGDSVLKAFEKADDWIARAVKSIWAILSRTGLINLDFASLRQVFSSPGGKTLFGLGYGRGETPMQTALNDLMLCPLLHTPEFARKADRLLVNIVGGPDLTISHVNEIMHVVNENFGRDAHVALGAVIDEGMSGSVEICVLGMSDIHGRGGLFGRKGAVRQAEQAAFMPSKPAPAPVAVRAAPEAPQVEAPRAAVETKKAPAGEPHQKKKSSASQEQEEFSFSDAEKRGFFDRTEDNLFDGQDLDVPTYLRKGIRISLN